MPMVMTTAKAMTSLNETDASWMVPDWPAPPRVRSLITSRREGVSHPPYHGFNLATHVGDDPQSVAANRTRLRLLLPSEPRWLDQVHGCEVVVIHGHEREGHVSRADASMTRIPNEVCVVMTADCLPVLLCDRAGQIVAAVHAGWRGLCNGVIEQAVVRMGVPAETLLAYLGPAIGSKAFEVGDEVRTAFLMRDAAAEACFKAHVPGKWWADIYALARQRLAGVGVASVFGGGACTFSDADKYFSYRRDGARSGRMASLIWLTDR